jgi:hypothetical protein
MTSRHEGPDRKGCVTDPDRAPLAALHHEC